jgi:hypothetical protein
MPFPVVESRWTRGSCDSTARHLGQIVRAHVAQTIVTEQRPSIGTRSAGRHLGVIVAENLGLEGAPDGGALPASVLPPVCRPVREPRRLAAGGVCGGPIVS